VNLPVLDIPANRLILTRMTYTPTPKALTHDEKKAADAAFEGRPFNKTWSTSARAIYDGIMNALPPDASTPASFNAEIPEDASSIQNEPLQPQEPLAQDHTSGQDLMERTVMPSTIRDREAAIQAGTLIDVTPAALQLGISFPVTITRPLWEVGVVTSESLSEEAQTSRLRDILMAFRLRLASLTTVSPLLDFPVLLVLPPSQVPQPVPLFALIQPDPTHQANVTILLPNEVALSITSLN
jgi:hypothetical protein